MDDCARLGFYRFVMWATEHKKEIGQENETLLKCLRIKVDFNYCANQFLGVSYF